MAHGDITHIDIPVSDKDAAKGFYGTVFGWQIAPPAEYPDYPIWTTPNEKGGGGLATRSERFSQPRTYVEVDSIDDTLALAVANGGTVLFEKSEIDEGSWWAAFADPDGNAIGLTEGEPQIA